jgi:two-component system cell cycle sensor histidine kinase/response regulator CckA
VSANADAARDPVRDEELPSRIGDWLLVGVALAISAAAIWLVSNDLLVTGAFAAALLAFGALAFAFLRRRAVTEEARMALPDWSVTIAAIERRDAAVAITDRAGRLVCANARYGEWFGDNLAPAQIEVDEPSAERIERAARSAWRDGAARVDLVETGEPGTRRWRGTIERAGRGEDYQVWRLEPIEAADPISELVSRLDGKMGRALARSGIAAALVDPDGSIRGASAGFALGATGDASADMAGREFVSFLRQDEDDRIGWARDGALGASLTLYYVSVADPDGGDADPDLTPSLILLVESGVGIGGGHGEGSTAAPHLEALLGQLPLGLAMADRDGRMLFANAAFMRAAGKEGEAPPRYPTDLVAREDKSAVADAIRRFAQGPSASGDIAIRLAAQPDEPVSLSLAGVRGLGEAAVLLGLTDSSEETRLKRQVAQATKMQAVGQLAGGVAHDFNNVLTAILGTCDLMLMRHTPGDSDYDDIQQIRANSNRAASLTRQLLAFSRQQTLRPEVLQLPDVVSDVSQMLRRLIGEKIQLVVTHDRDLGPVRADPSQLEQVIVNLAVNARDAMLSHKGVRGRPEASRLTLATRRITAADVRAMRSEIIPVGDYTALVVEDTGGGIPPENLSKIFEPFFTTKEQGRAGSLGGTGLGLSTVYGIVKQSGGFIFADSEVAHNGKGGGTRFTVYLPVHHIAPGSEIVKPIAAPAQDSEWAGGGRILLVEDEDPVRLVAERALSRQGYEVTSARDGEDGLEAMRAALEAGEGFDLVLSDVVMPALDGPSMAREIRKLAPEMPVLFMSGYAESQLRGEIDLENMHFIAKPFSVAQISDKVDEVLRASGVRTVRA